MSKYVEPNFKLETGFLFLPTFLRFTKSLKNPIAVRIKKGAFLAPFLFVYLK
jgi:hypothetical protein